MQARSPRWSVLLTLMLMLNAAAPLAAAGDDDDDDGGLNARAERELRDAGVDKYLGEFEPISSEPFAEDWVRHTFDTEAGDGPICIAGTPYSVFTKEGDPDRVLIFLQGGGACWEGFPRCNVTAERQFPPPAEFLPGIFAETSADGSVRNDIADWSVVYLPYCDGSVFGGDNDVFDDPTFGIRRHRGLRNLSAGMDVATAVFPEAEKILISGSSAGGAGTAGFAPFLARFNYGNDVDLYVANDAGPLALNPEGAPDAAAARARDWKFDQFYPRSCSDQGLCDIAGQQTGIIQWRLQNDSTVLESFYETDGDLTNLGFVQANLPGFPPFVPVSQSEYRDILDQEHGALNAAFPDRYKRFIVSGGNPVCFGRVVYSHTAFQGGNLASFGCPGIDLFFDLEAGGEPLYRWVNDFVLETADGDDDDDDDDGGDDDDDDDGASSSWTDIVEDFVPGPPLGP